MEALLYVLELGGRMLLLSALLMFAYVAFLRRRADYRLCRRLLLSVPFFCLAVPALHLAYGRLSELREPRYVELTRAQVNEYFRTLPANTTVHAALPQGRQSVPFVEQAYLEHTSRVVMWGVPVVSAVLLLLMGGQLLLLGVRCRRMVRRYGEKSGGVVRSHEVDTPFSFGRRIFLPAERLTESAERMIVMHEQAHIRLGHSAEGMLMEVCCRLLWFNPFVWMARKELRNVQEFEADRQVLDAGTEILAYQTLLLEETMKECPVFADGFNRSFVRRRFVEMKSAGRHKCSPASRWLAVLAAVGMTGLASAGQGRQAVVLKIVDGSAQSVPRVPVAPDFPVKAAPRQSLPLPDSVGGKPETGKSSAPAVPEDKRPVRAEDGWPILYDLPLATSQHLRAMRMRHTETETHLIFEQIVDSDDEFFKFGGPECYLVDNDTQIHYQARRSVPAQAWDHFHLRGMEGKRITVTVVFPRLPESVREIALYRVTSHLQSNWRYRVKDILEK